MNPISWKLQQSVCCCFRFAKIPPKKWIIFFSIFPKMFIQTTIYKTAIDVVQKQNFSMIHLPNFKKFYKSRTCQKIKPSKIQNENKWNNLQIFKTGCLIFANFCPIVHKTFWWNRVFPACLLQLWTELSLPETNHHRWPECQEHWSYSDCLQKLQ